MGKIFQLRTKVKINSKIDKGFTFNCPSTSSIRPSDKEVKEALENIGGKGAGDSAYFSKCEILS